MGARICALVFVVLVGWSSSPALASTPGSGCDVYRLIFFFFFCSGFASFWSYVIWHLFFCWCWLQGLLMEFCRTRCLRWWSGHGLCLLELRPVIGFLISVVKENSSSFLKKMCWWMSWNGFGLIRGFLQQCLGGHWWNSRVGTPWRRCLMGVS